MTRSYAFYDVVGDNDDFHVQCEWFNETVDLEQQPNVKYGIMTITNLQDYWQHTSKFITVCSANLDWRYALVDHDLLLQSFPVSNALMKEQRNNVLTAAFLSVESLNESKLEWKITSNEHGELQVRNQSMRCFSTRQLTGGLCRCAYEHSMAISHSLLVHFYWRKHLKTVIKICINHGLKTLRLHHALSQ